jgi:hypothetical protein
MPNAFMVKVLTNISKKELGDTKSNPKTTNLILTVTLLILVAHQISYLYALTMLNTIVIFT